MTQDNQYPTIHGHRYSPTYQSWRAMRKRCLEPNHKSYHRYGGAGITICDEWNDFSNFLSDMGERPDGKSLDRIDNTKGYTPDNCRWATLMEQARNRKDIIFILHDGHKVTLKELSKLTGVSYHALYYRYKQGKLPTV